MREAKFSIDTLGDNVFESFTQGEEWNGWACPYFTFDQAQTLVQAYQEGWYDEDSDAFSFEIEGGSEEDVDTFPATEIKGMKVYPIGAFS
jgi:hypothetical protein